MAAPGACVAGVAGGGVVSGLACPLRKAVRACTGRGRRSAGEPSPVTTCVRSSSSRRDRRAPWPPVMDPPSAPTTIGLPSFRRSTSERNPLREDCSRITPGRLPAGTSRHVERGNDRDAGLSRRRCSRSADVCRTRRPRMRVLRGRTCSAPNRSPLSQRVGTGE